MSRARTVSLCLAVVLAATIAQIRAQAPDPLYSPYPRLTAEVPRVADAHFWSLAASVYTSAAADWHTTRMFREQEVDEANPVMEPFVDNGPALAAVKVGAGSLVNWASYNLKKDGKKCWAAPQITWIILNLAVSVHNYRQLDD